MIKNLKNFDFKFLNVTYPILKLKKNLIKFMIIS